VYPTEGYEQSVSNLARTSLRSDMVFSDGADQAAGHHDRRPPAMASVPPSWSPSEVARRPG